MKVLDCLALLVIILAALNWGAIGIFDYDAVHKACKALTSDDKPAPEEPGDVGEVVESVVDKAEPHVCEMAGERPMMERIVFIVVGIAGLFTLLRRICPCCRKKESSPAPSE
ncbi:hypothetical protein LCGC14_0647490 [marine sediment metagenome]|uniref:DUF378 domain-containing protein n=1 Tax=marine sediment metagenome TaxID=412755 RepID=A0A0F9RGY0_9ZZZZ|nr:DUF378 domain-containing protein [Phycisphaerae bacterium]HDZ43971.1 DUF378 domain-containing protein [Phycisphaerae bacterium]